MKNLHTSVLDLFLLNGASYEDAAESTNEAVASFHNVEDRNEMVSSLSVYLADYTDEKTAEKQAKELVFRLFQEDGPIEET